MAIPKLVVTAGLMAAQVAIGMTRKIEGPRLDDRKPTLAEYGTPLPRFWGVRRFEGCPVPWAEDLREKKKKSKGKAGKAVEYKYYGTWMAVIADCEIDAVRKIYLDNHLVYQVAGVGPIAALILTAIDPAAEGAEIKVESRNLATYLGTESQLPDPRMEAWYEDHADFGADSCPAHRGTAYLVFKDIPLEKFGNRIPQVSVEAVRVKSALFPVESKTTTQDINGKWSFGGGWVAYWDTSGQIEWWDAGSRTLVGNSPAPGSFVSSVWMTIDTDGTAYGVSVENLITTSPLGVPVLTELTDPASAFFESIRVFSGTAYVSYADNAGYIAGTVHTAHSLRARDFCIDDNGDIWGLFQPDGSSNSFTLENLSDTDTITFTSSVTRSDVSSARVCFSNGNFFVDGDDGRFHIVSRETETVVSSGVAAWTSPADLPAQVPNATSFWEDMDEYSLEDGTLIRALDSFDWIFANIAQMGYDPVTHANWMRQSATTSVHILYLDRIAGASVTLGTIVDEVSDWCGITADVAALTQEIDGYSVIPGTGREMIEHLLDAHDSICRTHDMGVQFIKRSTSSQGTIEVENFVREGDEPRYTVSSQQDSDLPREIVVTYADANKDQQVNTVTARRQTEAVDSVRSQTINLETYVGTPDEMQQLADRYLRRKWNSKVTVTNGLTAQYLAAECGDVYDLDLDGVTWTAELEKLTFEGGALKCEWRRTFPSLNSLGSNGGPDMTGSDEDEIFVPGPTKGFVLDIPLVEDADSNANPLLYYAAGGYDAGDWPGAVVYDGGLDGEEYDDWNSVSSSDKAIWGYTTNELADVATPWLWDRGNSVNINTFGGALSSSTEAAIDADPTVNLCYLGGELLNFVTATLQGDGTYTLSGFKRGRRGTEWATGDHATGDEFVLVSDLANDARGASEIGNNLFFKVQSYGRDPDMVPAIEVDFDGNSLKPYAPARMKREYDGTDLDCTIIRRTRVGGAWVGGSTIPLSENSEEYEVDVYSGATFKRTITVTDTNTFSYTAAMAATDSITLPNGPTFNVYQMSDAIGRGFALAA